MSLFTLFADAHMFTIIFKTNYAVASLRSDCKTLKLVPIAVRSTVSRIIVQFKAYITKQKTNLFSQEYRHYLSRTTLIYFVFVILTASKIVV